jgi:general secretion pathway protein K
MRTLQRQRGVAVITALLLTTLAISIVASLFWQQQVQVRSMENQRLQLQTKWILRGALDWANLVLRQDAMDNTRYTSLDQVWATPLADTRLDQYIERERVQGENFDATLSGNVVDATSRYNLNNLAAGGQPLGDQVEIFQRLLKNLQLNPALANTTAQFVAAAQAPVQVAGAGGGQNPRGGGGGAGGDGGQDPGLGGTPPPDDTRGGGGGGGGVQGGGAQPGTANPQGQSGTATMKLVQLDDLLAVPGFTPVMIERLRPFAMVLPASNTTINVNTAPAEVLSALAPEFSVMQANSLVEYRKHAPWTSVALFAAQARVDDNALDHIASVRSDWFLVQSHIKLDRATLNVEALVSRTGNALSPIRNPQVQWIRQI